MPSTAEQDIDTAPEPQATAENAESRDLNEFGYVDPRDLVLDPNIRTAVKLDPDFVRSIKERGVLQAITVRRAEDGRLRVLLGQRRTLAAVEAGLDRIPFMLTTVAVDEPKKASAQRVVSQIVENVHRDELTEADQVGAHQELLDLGLTAAQISRRTHTPAKQVKARLKVAGSQIGRDLLTHHADLTLEQVAAIIEFEDDPAAAQRLTDIAAGEPEQFLHMLARLRDAREYQAARATLANELEAAGVRVINDPDTLYDDTALPLTSLRTDADTPFNTPIAPDCHATCPGHAAMLEDQPHSAQERVAAVYVCERWREHGHQPLWRNSDTADIADIAETGACGEGPQAEADNAQAEAAAERRREERRTVIANNRDWESALQVRREWLIAFLGRKNPPKDAARWVARMLATGDHGIRRALETSHTLATKLLGLAGDTNTSTSLEHWYRGSTLPHPIDAAAAGASPPRCLTLLVGMVVAALEANTNRDTWRNPSPGAIEYFHALEGWGYPLSPVERLVLSDANVALDDQVPAENAGGAAPDDGETTHGAS